MAFCIKCGTKLSEEDRFCPMCGEPKYIPSSEPIPSCSIQRTVLSSNFENRMRQYRFYHIFQDKRMFSSSIFTITDRSIIFNYGNEVQFSRLTTFLFEDYDYYTYTIDGTAQKLHYCGDDRVLLQVMLVYINSTIEPYSLKQQVRKVAMAQLCYERLRREVEELPITVSQTDKYPEVVNAIEIKPIANAPIAPYAHQMISNFMYVQYVLNKEYIRFKELSVLGKTDKGNITMSIGEKHRNSSYLIDLANHMKDSEASFMSAVSQIMIEAREKEQRQRQLAEEAQRRREEAVYYEDQSDGGGNSGGGFLTNVAATATGVVIGNKLSNKKNNSSEKGYYLCPFGCKFKYKEHGVDRCRLSTNWLNSPEPDKCGNGQNIYK